MLMMRVAPAFAELDGLGQLMLMMRAVRVMLSLWARAADAHDACCRGRVELVQGIGQLKLMMPVSPGYSEFEGSMQPMLMMRVVLGRLLSLRARVADAHDACSFGLC